MRNVAFLGAAVTVACWAVAASAIQPPRVIELTDGSIPLYAPIWSPDGKRIAVSSGESMYIIEAKENAQPRKFADFALGSAVWVSDSELVGKVIEQQGGHPKVYKEKLYRVSISGNARLLCEGGSIRQPFLTTAGRVWYDSAGIYVPNKILHPPQTGEQQLELRLVNHAQSSHRVIAGRVELEYQDTDLWLETPDGKIKKRVREGQDLTYAAISGDGSRIVVIASGSRILVMTPDGEILAKVDAEANQPERDRYSTLADPVLSPDNQRLLFIRGWEGDKEQRVFGKDVYLFDLRDGSEIRVTNDATVLHRYPKFNSDGSMTVCEAEGNILLLIFGSGK